MRMPVLLLAVCLVLPAIPCGCGGAGAPPLFGPGLIDLEISAGVLTPGFRPEVTLYAVDIGMLVPSVTITPTADRKSVV